MADHGQRAGDFHQLVKVPRECHAGQRQQRILQSRVAGQARGVRKGGFGAGPAFAPLEQDDRFFCPVRQFQKPAPPHDGFQVQGNGVGFVVLQEIFQHVAFVDVHFIADGTGLGDADGPLAHQIGQKSGGQHAALDDHGNAPGNQAVLVNVGVHEGEKEFPGNVHQTHAVGAPEADARFARDGEAALLQRAAFSAGFGKARAFDDDAPDALSPAGDKRLGHGRRRDDDDGQIHRPRNVFHRREAGQGLDFGVIRVDGIHAARETHAEVDEDLAAQTVFARGCADDGNGRGIEKSLHERSLRKKVVCACGRLDTTLGKSVNRGQAVESDEQ